MLLENFFLFLLKILKKTQILKIGRNFEKFVPVGISETFQMSIFIVPVSEVDILFVFCLVLKILFLIGSLLKFELFFLF